MFELHAPGHRERLLDADRGSTVATTVDALLCTRTQLAVIVMVPNVMVAGNAFSVTAPRSAWSDTDARDGRKFSIY